MKYALYHALKQLKKKSKIKTQSLKRNGKVRRLNGKSSRGYDVCTFKEIMQALEANEAITEDTKSLLIQDGIACKK